MLKFKEKNRINKLFKKQNINVIVAYGFDKKYEWTASLGLMVTIVWIYVKVLRILAIIASRSRD